MEFEDEVQEMIDCHQEGDYLDFKEYDYDKNNKEEMIKDIIALANSHSTRNKYIIIGAIEKNNVCIELREIDKKMIRDEADFQQIINAYIKENLIVNYRVVNINGKDILAVQILTSNNANRPFLVKKQIGKLKENEIYIRKGSMTTLANKKDLEYMYKGNKSSKLVLQSYLDGELSDKILLSNVNTKIEEYKQKRFKELKKIVEEINKLNKNKCSYILKGTFLPTDKIVYIEEEKKEFIIKRLKDLNIKYDDSIFKFKNIRWRTDYNTGGLCLINKNLYGDKDEIEQYWKLQDLDTYILEYLAIDSYFKGLPEIYSTNFVLSNVGNYFDEDIELKLIIDKDVFIGNGNLIANDSVIKYLGNMYDDLREYLIECPRVSSIDEYYYPAISSNSVLYPNISSNVKSIYYREPTYLDKITDKADNFKNDLEGIYEDSIYEENNKIIIKIEFGKMMQNKSMFLEAKLLFKNKEVKIDYEISSKNKPQIMKGSIVS